MIAGVGDGVLEAVHDGQDDLEQALPDWAFQALKERNRIITSI